MNKTEVLVRQSPSGGYRLLYSHDDGFTRHVVEFDKDGKYRCMLNESVCFRRGTHDRMMRLHEVPTP